MEVSGGEVSSLQGPSWDIEQSKLDPSRGVCRALAPYPLSRLYKAEAAKDSIQSAGWLCGKALPAGFVAKQLWWKLRTQGGLVPT